MNDSKLRVGFIGAGLMGHGMARNIIEKGKYPLATLAHRNREPIEDLMRLGARELQNPAEIAGESDVVILCLPGTEVVQDVLYGENGLAENMRESTIVIDTTTTLPSASIELAEDLGRRGVTFMDAPLGRSPKEAEEGRLGCYIGGPSEAIDRVEPILKCFAENIVRTGPVGSGGTCKILNNFITLGNCAVIAEAVATARHLGIDLETFYQVVSSSGANSRMFQQMMPWALKGDDSTLKGQLHTAMKDLTYYGTLSRNAQVSSWLGSTMFEIYRYANNKGYGQSYLPSLSGIMAALNGDTIHPLNPDL